MSSKYHLWLITQSYLVYFKTCEPIKIYISTIVVIFCVFIREHKLNNFKIIIIPYRMEQTSSMFKLSTWFHPVLSTMSIVLIFSAIVPGLLRISVRVLCGRRRWVLRGVSGFIPGAAVASVARVSVAGPWLTVAACYTILIEARDFWWYWRFGVSAGWIPASWLRLRRRRCTVRARITCIVDTTWLFSPGSRW